MVQKGDDDVLAGIDLAVIASVDKDVPAGRNLDEVAVALPDVDGRERPGRMENFVIAIVDKNRRGQQ